MRPKPSRDNAASPPSAAMNAGNRKLEALLELKADHILFEQQHLQNEKKRILQDVQANILKASKHRYQLFCLLNFSGDKQATVKWLKNLPLTSALDQIQTDAKEQRPTHLSLLFSHAGYRHFYHGNKIRYFLPDTDEDIAALRAGPTARCPQAFGDEAGGQNAAPDYQQTIHALILIDTEDDRVGACLQETDAEKRRQALFQFFTERTATDPYVFREDFGSVFFEIGLRNPEGSDGAAREWFGFRDGISNPRFFPNPGLEKKLGFRLDEPARLNTVLHRNRLSPNPYGCGSYVAFLKLEQNVPEFDRQVEELAQHLGFQNYPGYAAAYLMGRHRDGAPLHESFAFPNTEGRNLNDFDFEKDRERRVCPMHAHIRKANPRVSDYEEHPIVRRGRVYRDPNADRGGLLFLSYQSNLRTFEDIVNRGLYGYQYRNRKTGKDPFAYRAGEYQREQRYYNLEGKPRKPYLRLQEDLVTFRGGRYFHAPSISFIRVNLENCM